MRLGLTSLISACMDSFYLLSYVLWWNSSLCLSETHIEPDSELFCVVKLLLCCCSVCYLERVLCGPDHTQTHYLIGEDLELQILLPPLFLGVRINRMHHHTQFYASWGWNPGLCALLAKHPTNRVTPHPFSMYMKHLNDAHYGKGARHRVEGYGSWTSP